MLTTLRHGIAVLLLLTATSTLGYALYHDGATLNRPAAASLLSFALPALASLLAATLGLIGRYAWARWLGLAIGLSTASLFGGLASLRGRGIDAGLLDLLLLASPPLLVLALAGETMAQRFSRGSPFRQRSGRARLLAGAIVLGLAALPTLWAFACLAKSVSPLGRAVAAAATLAIALGSGLLLRQRTAGLLLLLLGSCLALGLATVVFCYPHLARADALLTAQWLLAALGGGAGILATARPIARVLLGRPPLP